MSGQANPPHPTAAPAPSEEPAYRPSRRLPWLLSAVALGIGLVHAYAGRYSMCPDGISYLDMGDAYLRGDFQNAVNAHWSPLFSWIVGTVLRCVKPPPALEFQCVNGVVLVLYLCSLGSFLLLMREMNRFRRRRSVDPSMNGWTFLPEWAWWTLAFALFLWCSLPLKLPSPDTGIATLVYLISAILLHIRNARSEARPLWPSFAILGVVLGVAFLMKAPMFPLAFVFLACAAMLARDVRRSLCGTALALCLFAVIAAPFIVALSRSKGRLTFGDSARLNYAWMVNGAPEFVHWQGRPPGTGTPTHPTRQILDRPAVYEFATPIGGTYPAWYDPSYWHEGLTPHFDAKAQLRVLLRSVEMYFHYFYHWQAGLIVGLLALLWLSDPLRNGFRSLTACWPLAIPAIAAMGMYAIVYVSLRYVAPFLLILWVGLIGSVTLPDRAELTKPVRAIASAMLVIMAIALTVCLLRPESGSRSSRHTHWVAAEALLKMGVKPGAKVAFIGDGFTAYWARLARVRIVAEVPEIHGDAATFRSAYPWVKDPVLRALATTPAQCVIAQDLPASVLPDGWQQVADTKLYLKPLPHPTGP